MSEHSAQFLYEYLKRFEKQIHQDQTLNCSLYINQLQEENQTIPIIPQNLVRTPFHQKHQSFEFEIKSDAHSETLAHSAASLKYNDTHSLDPANQTPLATETPLFGLKPASISIHRDETLEANFDPHTLEKAGDFVVHTQLGEGGMGQVFEGTQSCLQRNVALKVSKANQHNLRFLAQVFHEAQITAGLEHPNILPIYLLAQTADGRPIQVMKRIEGVSWHDLIYQTQHPLWNELKVAIPDQTLFHLNVLLKVSQAMRYAHEKQIIHRDLKPENVMIGRFGEVYVLDWGVAIDLPTVKGEGSVFWAQKESGLEDALVGTPAYMPPEMAIRDIRNQGPWSDVYLLGAILYQIWTKRRLHQGENAQALLDSIMQHQLPPLPESISPEMKALLEKSLTFDHLHRLKDASVFYSFLKRAIPSLRSRELETQGNQFLEQLYDASLTLSPNSRRIQTFFDEARHLYLTARELWQENPDIAFRMCETLAIWIRYLIQMNELTSAQRALDEFEIELKQTENLPQWFTFTPLAKQKQEKLISEQYELHLLLSSAKEKKELSEQEHADLKQWRQDQDFNQSKSLRLRIAWVGLIFLGFGALILDLLSRFELIQMTAHSEFIAAISLTALAAGLSFIFSTVRRNQNQRNERFTQFGFLLGSVLITVVLNRLVGWQFHNNLEYTLLHEMPVIMIGCLGLTTLSPQKDFNAGALSFGIASILSIFWTSYLTLFYALAMVTLWSGVLYTWMREGDSELV